MAKMSAASLTDYAGKRGILCHDRLQYVTARNLGLTTTTRQKGGTPTLTYETLTVRVTTQGYPNLQKQEGDEDVDAMFFNYV